MHSQCLRARRFAYAQQQLHASRASEPVPHWSAPRGASVPRVQRRVEPVAGETRDGRAVVRHKHVVLMWACAGLTTADLEQRLLALSDTQCCAVTKWVWPVDALWCAVDRLSRQVVL